MRRLPLILFFIIFSIFSLPYPSIADPSVGEEIFKKKCAICHKTTEQTHVGPGLKGVTQRRSVEWLDKWLKDPAGMIKKGDPTAKQVKKRFLRTMPTIAEMKDDNNRAAVIEYLMTLE